MSEENNNKLQLLQNNFRLTPFGVPLDVFGIKDEGKYWASVCLKERERNREWKEKEWEGREIIERKREERERDR